MKNHRPSYLLVLLLGVFMLSTCDDPVGIITYEQPELPNGTRELVIRVTDDKNIPITGYALRITGPTSIDVNVAGNEYTFTNLANGVYTLQVSKTGFIGTQLEVPVTLPADPKLNFFAASNVRITALAAPVTVNNAQGGTVSIAGVGTTGARSQASTLTIPPGALGSSGSTNLRATRRPPAAVTRTGPAPSKVELPELLNLSRIPLDSYIIDTGSPLFEPIPFNSALTLTIPVGIPTALRTAQFSFVVMSGSLTTGTLTPTSESVPMTVTPNGDLTVSITKPTVYQIFVDLGLSTTNAQSPPFEVGKTACGVGGEFTVRSPSPAATGTILSFLSILPPAATATSTYEVEAIPGVSIQVNGVYNYIDYRVFSGTGATLETYRYPLTQVTVSTTLTNCHNSGGS